MRKIVLVLGTLVCVCCLIVAGSAVNVAAQGNSIAITVSQAANHAAGPPLDEVRPIPPESGVKRMIPFHPTHAIARPSGTPPDPVLQQPGTSNPLTATTGAGFYGVGVGLGNFSVQYVPPDTIGAAGATQYVQWVNASFAVFDKSTGAVAYGPAAGNTLWQSLGGSCAAYNDGDPIAQYDKQAARWVMMQPVFHSPYYLCIAVSKTSDATSGGWNLYQFVVPNNTKNFPDYPKLAVWPDGYYISFNSFLNGSSYQGPEACVVDRNSMLAGQAATIQCTVPLGTGHGTLLPSDLDGSTAPPAGSSDYFMDFETNSLNIWKFHVDFTTPSNSTFTGPISVNNVASFSEACGGGACIPQPGTNNSLDSLGDRLMYRLAYRNFGSYESMVVTHSVATGNGNVGARWYEVRSPGSSPKVYQQGTYSPDFTNSRWMGSVAMDQSGDIALGYSESSTGQYPAIYFTGRTPSDPLGQMETETLVRAGTGSQTTYNRWGDYSSMSIDPTDDCTFWYTNEYLQATGVFNWSTWIVPLKFSNCGSAPSPDFSLSASPSGQTVTAGSGTSYSVTVTALNGYTGTADLSVSGLPSGAGATFSPSSSVSGGSGSVTMNISTIDSTPAGTYTLTITGTDSNNNSLTHSTTVSLTVSPVSTGDFSLSAASLTITVPRGSSGSDLITITPSGGFSGSVSFSVTGLPKFTNSSFSPNPATTSSTLTLSANKHATSGSYPITVTGTSGSLNHSLSLTLSIK